VLDLGWSEMAIIATVALFVIGPKDLPKALRTLGRYGGQVKALAREFQTSIDDAVKDAEKDLHLEEVKKGVQSFKNMDMDSALNATEKLAEPRKEGEPKEIDDADTNEEKVDNRPTVTANKHFVQVGGIGAKPKNAGGTQAEDDSLESEVRDEETTERKALPLPTGVQQVADARKRAEAEILEETDEGEAQLESVTQEQRTEQQ